MTHGSGELSLAERIALLPSAERSRVLGALTTEQASSLRYDWNFWARPKQLAPAGDWRTWLLCAGRGFGKTLCVVQWALQRIEQGKCRLLHIVTATAADGRDVIVEGDSGFLAKAPPWLLSADGYEPSKRRLTFKNGARAILFSADEPRQLRGPQCDTAIADELAAWRYPEAWDMLMMGLRLGNDPRVAVATTPRPTPFIKEMVKRSEHDPSVRVTKGSTFENRSNLAGAFIDNIVRKYAGTRLGRQELEAEILDDAPGALWKLALIEANRVPIGFDGQPALPPMKRIVIAVDPSVTERKDERSRERAQRVADAEGNAAQQGLPETGIIVCGLGDDDHGYVLADRSCINPSPDQWARAARDAYHEFRADRVICETNNGGDLVEGAIRAVDRSVAVKQVRASRGKQVRAEPVAGLDEQHRIHHLGVMAQLEDQMVGWEPGVSTWSPNRVDARVWGFTELMLNSEWYGGTDWDVIDKANQQANKSWIDGGSGQMW